MHPPFTTHSMLDVVLLLPFVAGGRRRLQEAEGLYIHERHQRVRRCAIGGPKKWREADQPSRGNRAPGHRRRQVHAMQYTRLVVHVTNYRHPHRNFVNLY